MADRKCGLRYCGATVADYKELVNVMKCQCLTCFGDKCESCDIYKKSLELQIDLQKDKCVKCRFYNGR